jgi:hypothetical protein
MFNPDGKITAIVVHCRIRHNAGHFEENFYPAVPDGRLEGKVSPSQLIQLAITYAKRQTLAMGLGIATEEDRNDSDSHGAPKINDEQAADLRSFIEEVKLPMDRFLKHFKIEGVEDLPAKELDQANRMLEKRRAVG